MIERARAGEFDRELSYEEILLIYLTGLADAIREGDLIPSPTMVEAGRFIDTVLGRDAGSGPSVSSSQVSDLLERLARDYGVVIADHQDPSLTRTKYLLKMPPGIQTRYRNGRDHAKSSK